MSAAPHRLRRYREIYRRVNAKFNDFGGKCWLYGADGAVLQGGDGAPLVLPDGRRGEAIATKDHAGDWAWMPLGKATVDAWIVASLPTINISLLVTLLESTVKDSENLIQFEETVGQFGDRLAQGYEQMHVLFGLARLIDGAENPHSGVVRVLDKVRAGMPFPWLALKFCRGSVLRREVSGKFVISGRGAIDPKVIEDVAEAFLTGGTKDVKLVLPGDPSGLSERLGTELVIAPVRYEGETIGVLMAGEKNDEDPSLSSVEIQFLSACTDLLSVFHENLTRFADQRDLFMGTVSALTGTIDAKHRYTRGHSERVALLARLMAQAMGLPEQIANTYHLAGLLHDVGKIGVPENILSKPSRLSDEEFAVVKQHPRTGYEILKGIPHLEEVLPGVLHHHEQYCGRGYPDGLSGEDIPLIARVLALADTFDAMSSSRSYRAALSRETVLNEIRNCAGRQFDPALAEVFVKMDFTSFDELFARHGEQNALAA